LIYGVDKKKKGITNSLPQNHSDGGKRWGREKGGGEREKGGGKLRGKVTLSDLLPKAEVPIGEKEGKFLLGDRTGQKEDGKPRKKMLTRKSVEIPKKLEERKDGDYGGEGSS